MVSLFVPGEQRRIVAYPDGLYPGGHLRQAKVSTPNLSDSEAYGERVWLL